MPYLTFRFENTNDDQTFTVDDLKDSSKNPIFTGPVNHGDKSDWIQCWQGSDGQGRVRISGSVSVAQLFDVRGDNEELRY